MLRIYNTQTRQKELFTPITPHQVRMYVCGVTVYDYCHVGHARSAVAFDIIRKYFEYCGYTVTFAKNYTDIDDKIIRRALENNEPWQALAARFIAEHDTDMASLFVAPPTITPKATEHIDEMIAMIQNLIDQGYAYPAGGDVYFRISRFPEYGKLSQKNLEELQSGARIEVNTLKESPLDFVLWKGAKEGEPSWDAPFGAGRPGWHIECSAMGKKHLGDTFDIHGGGKDLVFPHHENEIAQSECANHAPFANYWIHNGFVNINDEKMSKSLGNFFTIRDILKSCDAEVLRFFLAQTHYRSPVDFCDTNLATAESGLERLYRFVEACETNEPASGNAVRPELQATLATLKTSFEAAMDDDFNTALAIAALFDAARDGNRLAPWNTAEQHALLAAFKACGNVLGIFQQPATAWFRHRSQATLSETQIEALIAQRNAARAAKDFATSDALRDQLLQGGVQIKDSKEGTTWSYVTS
ncbi:cysteine--tRNA ligase [Chrysiogenes arsenatis]|uniref:cysteine--tRNA ligase n=1 Tax=Chrysiogenes arsenatis TaxID=309797 RepID=UPI00042111FE|nr:cysteine--tRNA ligase [Chrysiogenes arsenatis]